jgi:hypothetical protein
MLTNVIHLDKLGSFRLHVRFNDGSEGAHDSVLWRKRHKQNGKWRTTYLATSAEGRVR